MKYIVKKSVVELPPKSGAIFNTTNISNKDENTYSATIIDELFAETKNNYMTKLYSASSHADTAILSESINNFYGVLLISHFSLYNVKGSFFIPSELAISTNLPIKANDMNNPTVPVGVNVVIDFDGKTLDIGQLDNESHLIAVYGVFRK